MKLHLLPFYSQLPGAYRRISTLSVTTTPTDLNSLLNIVTQTKRKTVKHAGQIHGQIIVNGHTTFPFLLNSLLKLYAQCGHIAKSISLFSKIPDHHKTIVSWTTLITRLSHHAMYIEALSVFEKMRFSGLYPNHFTFSAVLPSCANTSNPLIGRQIHGLVSKHGFEDDVYVGSALIDMYAKCFDMLSAEKVFDELSDRNLVSWNSMIVGYLENRLYDNAVLRQPLDSINSSPNYAFVGEPAHDQSLSSNENVSQQFIDNPPKQPLQEKFHSAGNDSMDVDASKMLKAGRRSTDKRASRKSSREFVGRENRPTSTSADDNCGSKVRLKQSKEAGLRNKIGGNDSLNTRDEFSMMYEVSTNTVSSGLTASREHPFAGLEAERASNYGSQDASHPGTIDNPKFYKEGVVPNGKVEEGNSYAVKISKSSKSASRSSVEQSSLGKEKKGHLCDEPIARMGDVSGAHSGNEKTFMKTMGLKKSSKVPKDGSEGHVDGHKKVKMLFPYEEFMKFFQYEPCDVVPRGLSNCGNSCYANAVLQCLTCTKPLIVYLLKRTHSRSCCVKRWCLMCELEQHVATLRDSVGPLSPSRILSQMRSMNCLMGDGSQEDAHEFLRLLVASMQSICLEEVGGEKQVHPVLQETTFIQHTFSGRLRSKVECLKCHHRSERCENIMDLTLEIFGWVESLEDALTQFTAWEDLDGENMYKCGRCTSYVRAKKQLSIDEAPNILTIVLKRFQKGSYGKINKCITFPEMLDMIPFMTGTYDIPPLYMLYAVVVHMDTLNASFSGHYISYVKDQQGNWLRIDDSEVQPVPMSQVMSEGAYILFYMRSFPRPPRVSAKHSMSKSSHKSPRPKTGSEPLASVASSVVYNSHTSNDILRSANRRATSMMTGPTYPEFSDAASSSDWSLFTSSDDASFTTESTRDSFSTATDHPDPLSSFFNTMYPSGQTSQRTVSCRMFSGSQSLTRFIHEEKGFVESYEPHLPAYPYNEAWSSDEYVNYPHDFASYDGGDDNLNDCFFQTSGSWCRQ